VTCRTPRARRSAPAGESGREIYIRGGGLLLQQLARRTAPAEKGTNLRKEIRIVAGSRRRRGRSRWRWWRERGSARCYSGTQWRRVNGEVLWQPSLLVMRESRCSSSPVEPQAHRIRRACANSEQLRKEPGFPALNGTCVVVNLCWRVCVSLFSFQLIISALIVYDRRVLCWSVSCGDLGALQCTVLSNSKRLFSIMWLRFVKTQQYCSTV
jgi:hypothetical protein